MSMCSVCIHTPFKVEFGLETLETSPRNALTMLRQKATAEHGTHMHMTLGHFWTLSIGGWATRKYHWTSFVGNMREAMAIILTFSSFSSAAQGQHFFYGSLLKRPVCWDLPRVFRHHGPGVVQCVSSYIECWAGHVSTGVQFCV
jgi:hypothetical protein